jgi:hypothetical protein
LAGVAGQGRYALSEDFEPREFDWDRREVCEVKLIEKVNSAIGHHRLGLGPAVIKGHDKDLPRIGYDPTTAREPRILAWLPDKREALITATVDLNQILAARASSRNF